MFFFPAACQVGQPLCKEKCDNSAKVPWRHNVMTLPTYLVGLSTLKADRCSYDSVLALRNGECWKKCFSLFLALSKSFQKDIPADGPVLLGNGGRIEVPVSWNRQPSYFQSRNGRVVCLLICSFLSFISLISHASIVPIRSVALSML